MQSSAFLALVICLALVLIGSCYFCIRWLYKDELRDANKTRFGMKPRLMISHAVFYSEKEQSDYQRCVEPPMIHPSQFALTMNSPVKNGSKVSSVKVVPQAQAGNAQLALVGVDTPSSQVRISKVWDSMPWSPWNGNRDADEVSMTPQMKEAAWLRKEAAWGF